MACSNIEEYWFHHKGVLGKTYFPSGFSSSGINGNIFGDSGNTLMATGTHNLKPWNHSHFYCLEMVPIPRHSNGIQPHKRIGNYRTESASPMISQDKHPFYYRKRSLRKGKVQMPGVFTLKRRKERGKSSTEGFTLIASALKRSSVSQPPYHVCWILSVGWEFSCV